MATLLVSVAMTGSALAMGGPMGGQMTPPGMELPDNWDDMTQEEQRTYMDENRPEGMEGMGQRGGMELPEG